MTVLHCPQCHRRPSERIGAEIDPVGNLIRYKATAPCTNPIHDLADAVGILCEHAAPIHRGFERLLVIVNRNASHLDLRGDERHYLDHVLREFEEPLRSGEYERGESSPG